MVQPVAASNQPLPILGVRPADLPDSVLVVGDPARAEQVAQRIGGVELARNREYVSYRGEHRGTPVAVVSHGVGAAGAGVAFDELCRAGCRRIIRAGTAGGMQGDVMPGDLVIVTAAVRDDGYTDRLVPPAFPAVASVSVTNALTAAAAAAAVSAHSGIVLTSAVFYPMEVLGSSHELWQRSGVVAVEMECSALFVVASQYGVESGAVLAIDGNPLAEGDTEMVGYNPGTSVVADAVDQMISIALDALDRTAR